MTFQEQHEFSEAYELKFASESTGDFSGHAAFFGNEDSHGDIIRPGAFAASLAGHKTAGSTVPLLWSHDMRRPIGRLTSVQEDGSGLAVRGVFNLKTHEGKNAHEHVKAGDANGLSIGYVVPNGGASFDRQGKRTLQRIDLREVSVVAMPSNVRARVREVKSIGSPRELEHLLREAGLPSRAAEKIAGPGFAALAGETNPETKSIDFDRVAAVLRAQALEIKSWRQ